jgi:AraC-like DNA-binding protein
MRFDRPVHRLVFDARSLDLPYTMPDPAAFKLAQEHCQRELDAMGLEGGMIARVRGLIPHPDGGTRSLEDVAAALRRSPRTLKRQLGAQGASFSSLRDAELRERAMLLLRAPELSLAQIADRLGYSNVTNFERAFVRWTWGVRKRRGSRKLAPLRSRLRRVALGPGESIPHDEATASRNATGPAARSKGTPFAERSSHWRCLCDRELCFGAIDCDASFNCTTVAFSQLFQLT